MSSVLVVDDNSDIRSLVRTLVQGADGLEVVGEAASGGEALRVWADTHPDVIVLDQDMPGISGMEVARIILGEQPDQTVILFTAYGADPELGSALSSGVSAVLSKERVLSLVSTIRRCCPDGTGLKGVDASASAAPSAARPNWLVPDAVMEFVGRSRGLDPGRSTRHGI